MSGTGLDWSDLELFLHVARGGGLARAAAATGQSPPTLSRRMRALERALGQTLFRRHARGYDLTPVGEELLQRAGGVERLVDDIRHRGGGASLPVHVSAGTWMSRFLAQNVEPLLATGARIAILSSESRLDIGRREALIGLRNHRPTEAGLAGRRVARVAFAPYAGKGSTETGWLTHSGMTPSAKWVRAHHPGNIRLEVNAPHLLLDLARQGAGRVVLPCFVGDAEKGLVRVGDRIEELTHDQWLVTHDDERRLPEVRGVIDAVAALLRDNARNLSGEAGE